MFLDMLAWHYGGFLKFYFSFGHKLMLYLYNFFSVKVLLKSLFLPWKNDTKHIINPTLADRFKVFGDNLISRVFGFAVRCMVIFCAFIIETFTFVGLIIFLLFWLVLPIVIVFLIVKGIGEII